MKWISVKDRLPEYEQEVLFVNGKSKQLSFENESFLRSKE